MLVDSHCHLDRVNLKAYDQDFDRLMAATRDAGVDHLLCVSIDLESYPRMRALVDPYPQVSVSVGVHPNERQGRDPEPEALVALAADPRTLAIGETGLDYYRSDGDLEWQRQRFRRHIAAARACAKPLIVHTREARADTLRILEEEQAGEAGGVLHCFTEDWDMARRALDLGFYLGFSGIVTFETAGDLRQVAAQVPLDRLLIETDSPYLTPVPYRGRPNEPRHVRQVAACLAQVRGLETEELIAITGDNFGRLFGFRPPDRLPEAAEP